MTHKTQVNIRIPNIESLYCINCKINPIDMQDPLVKSLFHSQILTCRLIIYTMRCCIASPSIQNADDLIHIVVDKSFYDSGKFQEHLSKLKVFYTDPEPVHPKIYEACLKYTFTFRLAPHWNLIGKSFYLQGFNFLSLTSNINAIEWKIIFKNSNDVKLELIPIKMNLFPLTLDSLSLPPKTVDGFTLNSHINSIDLTSFESPSVYVLPNLTKARIVSVSKTLPESCPFRNYDDLRRHWKNMYSYRLPKNEQGLLFYEVVFPNQPNQYFTYPETCILSKMPEILMCENKNEVASQFLKDLSTNVHSVCGEVIEICRLYPELNIEYSCVLRKRNQIDESQSSQLQQSAFFKTPGESTMRSQLVNEKLNLSSLLTFKGMQKMKPDMQSHSQKVLSIMQNNKNRKRKPLKENETDYSIQSMINSKKRKFGMNQIFRPSVPKIEYKETVIDNLEEAISFYDIPAMNAKYKEWLKSCQDESFKQIEDEKFADPMPKSHRPKPIIKNIENVCSDMTDSHLPTNFDELKINKTETNIENRMLLEKETNTSTHSTPESLNSMRENDVSENIVSDQSRKKIYNSPSIDESVYRKVRSAIQSVNLDDKILSEFLPKDYNNRTQDSAETQSYDQNIRSFLSNFDNMQEDNEIEMKKQLYEEYKKTHVESNKNNQTPNENLMENSLKTSVEKSEFSGNRQNYSKYDSSYSKWFDKLSNSSPSLLTSKKGRSTDVHQTYSKEMFTDNKQEYVEPQRDHSFENDCNVKRGKEFRHQLMSETNSTNSKRALESQSENHKRKFFETPQLTSTPIHDTFQESLNRKLTHKFESPVAKKNIEFAKHSNTENNEKSYRESDGSSIIAGHLQNSCKTPSLNSILDTIGNSEIAKKFNNSPQYSIDKFQSPDEVQGSLQYKKDINEYADQSDFLSILSESSNESDSGDYESCKLVFNEALTLKK